MSTRLTLGLSLLGFLLVSAGHARNQRHKDPHGHAKAYLQDKVVRIIEEKGNFGRAMHKVGINLHRIKDENELADWAQRNISLAATQNHQEVYNLIDKLVEGGFPGDLFPVYVRELFKAFSENTNGLQLIQVSPSEPIFPGGPLRYVSADRIFEARRMENIHLKNVQFLLGMRRNETSLSPKSLRMYLEEDDMTGIDITGPEKMAQDPLGIVKALYYASLKGDQGKLRIHAGEGYYEPNRPWEYPYNVAVAAQNPLRVLQVLDVATEHNTKYRNVEVILSHLTHIANFDDVVALVKKIRRRGVNLRINTNPLSNLTLKVAQNLNDIDAYRLLDATGMEDYTGSDNVFGIHHSRKVSKSMRNHDIEGATEYAEYIRNRRRSLLLH